MEAYNLCQDTRKELKRIDLSQDLKNSVFTFFTRISIDSSWNNEYNKYHDIGDPTTYRKRVIQFAEQRLNEVIVVNIERNELCKTL